MLYFFMLFKQLLFKINSLNPRGTKHKRAIKLGILIRTIIPKLVIKREKAAKLITLKTNKGMANRFLLIDTIIPQKIIINKKYQGIVSIREKSCRWYLICQGKGPNKL